jgi:hypothetical protein
MPSIISNSSNKIADGENSSAEIYNSCWKGGEIGFFEIGKYRNVKTKSISIEKKDVGI